MKVKVCGLRIPYNISAIESLQIDFLGFVFYPKSKRYIDKHTLQYLHSTKSRTTTRVGVFVNESVDRISIIARKYGLSYIQLHGEESPETCNLISEQGLEVIKAFNLSNNFNFNTLIDYEPFCKHLLFDTKGANKGGNGVKFDWGILENCNLNTPFFLSGGINPSDASLINKLKLDKLIGVDLNSEFEDSPGIKNILQVKSFLSELNKSKNELSS